MPDISIKQNDTWPPLEFILTDAQRTVASIAKSGSAVTVTTTTSHSLITGDYTYLLGTTNFSDLIARSITVTGARTYTYVDADSTNKATETAGTSNRAVDLTSAVTIKFIAKSTSFAITGNATKDANQTAARGKAAYTWATGDTANNGTYQVEFEVNWGGSPTKIETFPNSGYLELVITDDLG